MTTGVETVAVVVAVSAAVATAARQEEAEEEEGMFVARARGGRRACLRSIWMTREQGGE